MRVCEDIYKKGFSYNRKDGFYMDDLLVQQLDYLLKNIDDDWDFTIIITGSGEVRVGKSMLALEIGAYWSREIEKRYGYKTPFSEKNIVFDGKQLIQIGNELGQKYKHPAMIYDEAGADLEGVKVMNQMTQDVKDFFRECGQYNMLNIVVAPEFFDFPKGIALTRSFFLLNVDYYPDKDGYFQRGYFKFYSKPAKKQLYIKGKKELNYLAYEPDFDGRFYKFYPISEEAYRLAKREALVKRESKRRNKFQMQRDACWWLLTNEFGMTQQELSKRMEQLTGVFVAQQTLSDGIRHYRMENE